MSRIEIIIVILCAIYCAGYILINEINWKYVKKVIKKWISL